MRTSQINTATSYFWVYLGIWGVLGFGAGVLNGLLGAAGGILLISLLPHLPAPSLFRLPQALFDDPKDVMVTSLCVMLPVTVVSALLYLWQGHVVSLPILYAIARPAILGGLLGAFLMKKIPRNLLRKIFGLLVVLAGIRMLFK